jgi:hypothetical protein
VSGAVNDSNKLRQAEHEIDDLGKEKQDHSLREVTQNSNHSKCHTGKVAKSVSHEDSGRETVSSEQSQGGHEEWDHQGD